MPDLDLGVPQRGQDESGYTAEQRAALKREAEHHAGAKRVVDSLRNPDRPTTGLSDYIASGGRRRKGSS